MTMKKALFLDRDGVINVDDGYVSKRDDFIFVDGVFRALRYFKDLNYLLFIVTNQSGIGRGYYKRADFLDLTAYMLDELKRENIHIKKVYFCPHAPEEDCECRKPKPKMILDAIEEFGIDAQKSIMIGDKISDVRAGFEAGLGRLFLVGDKRGNFFENVKSLHDLMGKIKE